MTPQPEQVWLVNAGLTSTLGAQAPPFREGESAFLNKCAILQRYGLSKYLLPGPGTV